MIVIGSPGRSGWLGSGGGGSRASFEEPWRWEDLASSWGWRGRKLLGTRALGITETASGFREARRVVFSLLDSG